MPRLLVVRPADVPASPVPAAADPAPAAPPRDSAYGTVMSVRCALARFIAAAGHREPPRHRAA